MFITIITFFAVLGLLVLVHEIGHFVTARRAGVKVDEFGLGIPPRIFGFYRDQDGKRKIVGSKSKEIPYTIWSLNWIPLGGFVKIKGEEGEATGDQDSFVNKSVGTRIWIISAGVLMNIILAMFLLSISLGLGSPQVLDQGNIPNQAIIKDVEIRVLEVLNESPAQRAGVMVADTILLVDNQKFSKIEDLQSYFEQKMGTAVVLELKRDNNIIIKEAIPEIITETEKPGLGFALVRTGYVSYPWYIAPIYGIRETFKMVGSIFVGFYLIIKGLIVSHELIGEVYGPIGIATLVGDAVKLGFLYLIQFTAILSVIIAVINFLPLPALDGGRVFFLILEGLRGKPINQKIEAAIHNIGFMLLMLLVLVVTFGDIARISGGLVNWWNNIF